MHLYTCTQGDRVSLYTCTYTHAPKGTESLFGLIDDGLASFVEEMRAQGVWGSVVIQTVSEFGRALRSNGLGTDHGWGGNSLTLGGSINGGRVLGSFPATLALDGPLAMGRSAEG
jgi:uncharacterized protein (DUF1501 family)